MKTKADERLAKTLSSSRRGNGSRTYSEQARFVILTGLSGAGKSRSIRALEDLGYFCVDNLPTKLISKLAALTLSTRTAIKKTAMVVDVRDKFFLSEFPKAYQIVCQKTKLRAVLVFLEASDETLIRRFSETRRPHPLARSRSAIEGIIEERALLGPIKRIADQILDTSDMTVQQLHKVLIEVTGNLAMKAKLAVTVLTFGFKHGIPNESDLIFDVRFLPNPYFKAKLRKLSGRDSAVMAYLAKSDVTIQFLDMITEMLRFLIPQYVKEGKHYLTVSIGCTGGKHRSVAVGETLKQRLVDMAGVRLRVKHRDILAE